MTYVCIRCGHTWVVVSPSNHASGSICGPCMIVYIRCKQKQQGYDDCFKRAEEICSEKDCTYHELCCRDL